MMPVRYLPGQSAIKLLRLYTSACLISFLGSLPVGTLNIGVTSLVIEQHYSGALLFGLGAILMEVVTVRIALGALNRLKKFTPLLRWFPLLACTLILLISFITLQHAWRPQSKASLLPFSSNNPFVSGLILSLLNPLHLPFWMGWTAVLKSRRQFSDTPRDSNVFVLGIGMGTAAAFLAYAMLGHLLIMFLKANQNLIQWVTGIALLVVGLLQLRKIKLSDSDFDSI